MLPGIIYFLRSWIKKPFKVGLISYYYPTDRNHGYNGIAIHTHYLSRELARLGCEVHIFTRGERIYTKKEHIGEGKLIVHFINAKVNNPIEDPVITKRMSYFIFDNKIINEITKESSKGEFDVIHTHGWLTSGAFISKFFTDTKWVHTFHALEKNRLKFMSQEEKKYFKVANWIESTVNHADALISVSNKLKEEVLENYPVKKEKVFSIPNGVDLSLFQPKHSLAKERKILYIGRFSLEKGIDLVPKIAKETLSKDHKSKFLIIAPGGIIPSMEHIKEEFDELSKQYPERFVLEREPKSREELAEIYNTCSVFIQPSRYEAFGLTALEAMACGKAVICSNKGGLPEVVSDSGTIIPLNSKWFSKSIINLLDNFRLRERYGRRAFRKAQHYSWDKIAKKTLEIYKKINEKNKEGKSRIFHKSKKGSLLIFDPKHENNQDN